MILPYGRILRGAPSSIEPSSSIEPTGRASRASPLRIPSRPRPTCHTWPSPSLSPNGVSGRLFVRDLTPLSIDEGAASPRGCHRKQRQPRSHFRGAIGNILHPPRTCIKCCTELPPAQPAQQGPMVGNPPRCSTPTGTLSCSMVIELGCIFKFRFPSISPC